MLQDLKRSAKEPAECELVDPETARRIELRAALSCLLEAEATIERLTRGTAITTDGNTGDLLRGAQQALIASEARYRTLIERLAAVVLEIAPDGKILFINQSGLLALGEPPGGVVGRPCSEALGEAMAGLVACLRDGDVTDYQVSIEVAAGRVVILEFNSANQYSSTGELERIQVIGKDVTTHLATERALEDSNRQLRHSERLFRGVCDGAPLGVSMTDMDLRFILVNRALSDMLGYSAEELVGRSILDVTHADDREGTLRTHGSLANHPGPEAMVKRYVTRTDDVIWVQVTVTLVPDEDGAGARYISVTEDVTERRHAEDRRAAQYEVIGGLAASSDIEEGCRAVAEIIGRVVDSGMLGVIWIVNHGSGRLEFAASWADSETLCTEVETRCAPFTFALGEGLPGQAWKFAEPRWTVEGLGVDLLPGGPLASHTGVPFGVAVPLLLGCEVFGVFTIASAKSIESGDDLLNMFLAIGGQLAQFISRQRIGQTLRKTQEQLMHSQKMEAVGRLAGGVAHDFNNLLTVIMGYSALLTSALGADHPLAPEVAEICNAATHAASLTDQLLTFSRKRTSEVQLVDLNVIVTDSSRMLRRLIGEDVELACHTEAGSAMVRADRGQMEQVILNLAVNARDAMPRGGRLELTTSTRNVDSLRAVEVGIAHVGMYVVLSMRDSGHGMDAATQSHIFEPFFTTKGRSRGTGLGLSTVYGIVHQGEGFITVDSKVGRGTTFEVYLPLSPDTPPVAAGAVPEPSPRGTENILVVEDDAAVRAITKKILRTSGYNVSIARNGQEALTICSQEGSSLQLLLTDVVMPGMTGVELCVQVALLYPHIKLVLMSGHTDVALNSSTWPGPPLPLLKKPFSPDALLHTLRKTLEHGAPAS